MKTIAALLFLAACNPEISGPTEHEAEPRLVRDRAYVPSHDDGAAELECDDGEELIEPECFVSGGARLIAEGFEPGADVFMCVGRADDETGVVHARGFCK